MFVQDMCAAQLVNAEDKALIMDNVEAVAESQQRELIAQQQTAHKLNAAMASGALEPAPRNSLDGSGSSGMLDGGAFYTTTCARVGSAVARSFSAALLEREETDFKVLSNLQHRNAAAAGAGGSGSNAYNEPPALPALHPDASFESAFTPLKPAPRTTGELQLAAVANVRDAHSLLWNCNNDSEASLESVSGDLKNHMAMIRDMRKDLDFITRRVK